jgi:hypothetical protein
LFTAYIDRLHFRDSRQLVANRLFIACSCFAIFGLDSRAVNGRVRSSVSGKWLQRQQSLQQLDSIILKCGQLSSEDRQIDKFEYWHDRLVVLKQLFDDAEPRSLLQWWRDRRRPAQWYNFWFAVALVVGLTLLFGLAQSIEGGIQAYKVYNP